MMKRQTSIGNIENDFHFKSTTILGHKRRGQIIIPILFWTAIIATATLCFFLVSNIVEPVKKSTIINLQQSPIIQSEIQYLNVKKRMTDSNRLIRHKLVIHTAILLQRSPVNGMKQLVRLHTIDNGWSRWTHDMNLNINIYATVPNSTDSTTFKIIKTLSLIENLQSQANDGPLKYLIQSLISILILENDLKWLVIANDHTFIIPSNLNCFLSTLDSELLIYTGNKLIRGLHKEYLLPFASGDVFYKNDVVLLSTRVQQVFILIIYFMRS